MSRDTIHELLQKTFLKLAAPGSGTGMYAELEKALTEAYNIGKVHQEKLHHIKPQEEQIISYPSA